MAYLKERDFEKSLSDAMRPPRWFSSIWGKSLRSLSDRSSGSVESSIAFAYVMRRFTSSAMSDWFIDCIL